MDSVRDTACAVGCPIRKSTDHSLLAAPHGLSQRATSFIASQCQGIHQMPFRRLILIQRYAPRAGTSPNAHHTSPPQDALTLRPLGSPFGGSSGPRSVLGHLHVFFTLSMIPLNAPIAGRASAKTVACPGPRYRVVAPSYGPHSIRRAIASTPADWWRQTGSNRRPPACKAGALPTELCPRLTPRADGWWAREDLNLRPHAYQARALTN